MFMHLKDDSGRNVYPNIYEIEVLYEHTTGNEPGFDHPRAKLRMKSGKEFTIPQSVERVLAAITTTMEGA